MFVVMGATGHVGSACAEALLAAGEPVLALVHDPAGGNRLRAAGAEVMAADARDANALRAAFARGRRAFLLNPPANIAGDSDAAELATVRAILHALDGSGLEKVVAESSYGARPGNGLGDLSVLYELEEGLRAQRIPAAIQRGAYYYSNFDMQLDEIRAGTLRTMLPADLAMPMVSPRDLGRIAARLLREPVEATGITCTEGPARLTMEDVAATFAEALGTPVRVEVTPREGWLDAYRAIGFSDSAAQSYARMTAATIDAGPALPDDPVRGDVTIAAHVHALIAAD